MRSSVSILPALFASVVMISSCSEKDTEQQAVREKQTTPERAAPSDENKNEGASVNGAARQANATKSDDEISIEEGSENKNSQETSDVSQSTEAAQTPSRLASDEADKGVSPEETVSSVAPVSKEEAISHDWVMDKKTSTLQFTGTQTGNEFTGHFNSFDAIIRLDPNNLEASKVEVTIEMASAKTGDRQRDDALPGQDWFFVKAHPSAKFVATNVTRIDGDAANGNYAAAGTLTIRDISKDVSLPFTLKIDGNTAIANGGLSLQRNGFGVGQGQWDSDDWVKFDVGVSFTIEATRKN